jgi:hypothetical protein
VVSKYDSYVYIITVLLLLLLLVGWD